MRKLPFIIGISLFLTCVTFGQEEGRFSGGFVLGEPTGLAWKYDINRTNALAGAIGFSPFDRYRMHVDYLWQTQPFDERNLGLHYGAGMAFGFGRTGYIVYSGRNAYFFRDRDIGFGVRGVVGLNYMIPRSPVNLFFELAPLIVFTPNSGSGVDAGFGVRFYF